MQGQTMPSLDHFSAVTLDPTRARFALKAGMPARRLGSCLAVWGWQWAILNMRWR